MDTPKGVGPHTGRELELMLKGEKKAALFYDVIPQGGEIAEEIIPEKAFAPHVRSGKIIRFCKEFTDSKKGYVIRYVNFTLPGEEWRAQFLFWLSERLNNGSKIDDADDTVEGRILGYSEADISAYLAHKNRSRSG